MLGRFMVTVTNVRRGDLTLRAPVRVIVTTLSLVLLVLAGCAQAHTPVRTPSAVQRPPRPAKADLSTPEAAVRSYLAWTSYAFRIANSEVATQTMGRGEEVRVNSYVEMNKEKGRLIDQRLKSVTFARASVVGTTATLPAREVWQYRYLGVAGEQAQSALYTATYDTTYTVVATAPGRWLVDHVEAKALSTVK